MQLLNLRASGAFYMCPTREQAVRIAMIVTIGTLMTAAWLFVLGVLAMLLIEMIF
jgi:hypothetical protein